MRCRHATLVGFYKELLTVLHSLAAERNHRVMQMFMKKPVCSFPLDSPQAAYIQILTPYAFNLLQPHLDAYQDVEIARQIDDISCEFQTDIGRIVTSFDACPCFFRIATGLPCRHIMVLRHVKNVCIFERQLIPDRWTRTYNAARHTDSMPNGAVLAEVGTAMAECAYNVPNQSVAAPVAVNPEQSKVLSCRQKYKRVLSITNELATLAADAPMALYAERLQQIRQLRDAWKTERPSSGLSLTALDDGIQNVLASDDCAASNVKISGEDLVAVGVCETELVAIANSMDGALENSWLEGSESSIRYSDIKIPFKAAKRRGRPCGSHKTAGTAPPKKRVKV